MKSICLFSSYFIQDKIPFYIKVYLEELNRHFDELVFITNEKELNFSEIDYLKNLNIRLELVVNEGFDFGMWYKILTQIEVAEYTRIGLINDSCILFRKLDPFFQWINENGLDYCGLIDSNEINYHIQSYFLIINSPALISLRDYFLKNGVIHSKEQIIRVYEVGLSEYMIQKGFKLGAYFNCYKYVKMKKVNIFYCKLAELIRDGLPLVKQKTVLDYLSLEQRFKIIKWYPKIRSINKAFADSTENPDFNILLKDYIS